MFAVMEVVRGKLIDFRVQLPAEFHANSGVTDIHTVMGTGMGEDMSCGVPEVPLAHLEDDIDFVKAAASQQS
ncbi:unnamed protein product [Litomosoides sigmodontis]|uniref:Uncharacterized protein n=1 Tax=Litomosoides sigmodontis TaxID=42156 RepID=A0A3P6V249_LITSI|nr:unnamed protein product [Litomosoides sigmodontis]